MSPASKLWWPLLWRLVMLWLLVVTVIDQAAPWAYHWGWIVLRPELVFWVSLARFATMTLVLVALRLSPGDWPGRVVWGVRLGLDQSQWRAIYGELAVSFALFTLADYIAWRGLGFAVWVNYVALVFPVAFAGSVMFVSHRVLSRGTDSGLK